MSECQVGLVMFGVITDITCRLPADRRYRIMCLHEHLFESPVCPGHARRVGECFCLPCKNNDGHECPLGIEEIDGPAEVHLD